ncbi:amino acid ABC transporter ATP-binding protein [Dietzia lutea]|uniref:Ectoine/hydroxyectoine ABC transporter ATP-binding protein EhuA n=1 Tax=Dietzia lutea TaxID=546160 RepID=A0A2S1RCX1_9ACTN|nr:amino acid ABC transporter ATP-binding protein [Dietzia lutea]AWH94128.1 ectoine/hydroxyectoine ABC transporter ATP-binding protein EhuA [Dietzia lutea]
MVKAVGVRKAYGGLPVLSGFDLEVGAGEVCTILGPSGSGKSTFLRCVNHLDPIDDGKLIVDGQILGYRERRGKLYELRETQLRRQRRHIGMVFQHFNLFPHMTAAENVSLAPRIVHGRGRAETQIDALSLLDRVGLRSKAEKYPRQLSGGEQQRVAIARALAISPKLMLFDEPTSALDPELVGEVLGVIREVATSGITLLIVTHEMKFAAEVSDKVVFMDGGIVIEQGPPSVLTNPREERTRAFLDRVL